MISPFQFLPSVVWLGLNLATVIAAQDDMVQIISSMREFDSILKENEMVLVAFTSPFSKPSQVLDLELEAVVANPNLKTPIVSIDCSRDALRADLCDRNDVNSYPTIRLFKRAGGIEGDGTASGAKGSTEIYQIRYRGQRTANAITSFLHKSELPPLTILHDQYELDALKFSDSHVFIAYLDLPKEGETREVEGTGHQGLQEIFTSIAEDRHDQFVFGLAKHKELADNDNLPIPPPLVVSYKIAEGDNELLGPLSETNAAAFTREQLEEFIETTAISAIGEMTRRNMDDYYASGRNVIAYIFYDNPELRTNLRRELIPVAKRYRGYVRFATIDGIEYSHLATSLDVDPTKKDRYPALVVHSMFNDQVFRYNSASEITTEKVDQFILDILQGKMSSGGKQKTEEQGHDEL